MTQQTPTPTPTHCSEKIFHGATSVSVYGYTNIFPPTRVTASGSGTAESLISQADADNLALAVATVVANTALSNDINVINQSALIISPPQQVPTYRQIEIQVIVNFIKQQNDSQGIPNNFIYSNTLNQTYRNTPYLELQYPDSTGTTIYVYSTTYFQSRTYIFSNLGTDLVLDTTNVIINGSRTYVWDETIVNNIQVGTTEFPLTKTYQFLPQYQTLYNTTTQIMKKVASVPLGAAIPYYNTTTVSSETIYIYYASTLIFLLIDSNDTTNSTTNAPFTRRPKIYAMQTLSNLYFTDLNINNLYLLKNQLTLPAGTQPAGSTNYNYVPLPDGFNFVVFSIPADYAVYSVSTLATPAILISDGANNSYQYLEPKYNKFIYDQFNV
jgi:hypothetical protein